MAANKIPVNFDRGSMAAWPRYPYANEIPYTLGGPPFHGPPSCEAPRQPTIHTSSHLKAKMGCYVKLHKVANAQTPFTDVQSFTSPQGTTKYAAI